MFKREHWQRFFPIRDDMWAAGKYKDRDVRRLYELLQEKIFIHPKEQKTAIILQRNYYTILCDKTHQF